MTFNLLIIDYYIRIGKGYISQGIQFFVCLGNFDFIAFSVYFVYTRLCVEPLNVRSTQLAMNLKILFFVLEMAAGRGVSTHVLGCAINTAKLGVPIFKKLTLFKIRQMVHRVVELILLSLNKQQDNFQIMKNGNS